MNKLLDVQKPWFIPLWRRLLVVGICLFWAIVEWSMAQPFWGLLFSGLAIYTGYQFFVVFDPKDPEKDDKNA